MRRFENIDHALACAENGGQALFITGWIGEGEKRKDTAGQLFDADPDRLKRTVWGLQGGSDVLSPMQWRPGWLVYYIPITTQAVERALHLCFTRILRKTTGDEASA